MNPTRFILALGFGALLLNAVAGVAQPVLWNDNGHYYELVLGDLSDWDEAKSKAESKSYKGRQGHLVTITSPEEQAFIQSAVGIEQSPNWAWLGARQVGGPEPAGGWEWVTGEAWGTYTNWASGQPDNTLNVEDYLHIITYNHPIGTVGQWNDIRSGSTPRDYIVEYDLPGPLFEENFEDGTADGLTAQFGAWSIGSGLNGSANGYVTGSGSSVVTIDGIPSDNVRIEADFEMLGAAAGDFEFWINATISGAANPLDGYKVRVNPAGSDDPLGVITQISAGIGVKLDTAINTISANETHTLSVDRFGDDINAYLDGTLIMSASDATHSAGQIAIRLFDGGTVDNIRVSNPCDLDRDGDCDSDDVDALTSAGNLLVGVGIPPADDRFDLTFDTTVNGDDLARWLVYAGHVNGLDEPVRRGDTNVDGDVDTDDLTRAIINYTGAGATTKVWSQGDSDGDGDTDTSDLTTAIINFTGVEAASPNVPDLIYDPATGEVTIDADGADVISFSLQGGPFNAADFSELPAGLTDNIGSQIGWTSFNLFSGLTGTAELGAILPAGLDLAGLEAALTTASYGLALAGGGGGGRLDLIIPEPASMVLMGLGGLVFIRRSSVRVKTA